MHRVVKVVAAVAGVLLLPSIVFAQATIAGVVRDASAAVLPGVTVEASSPVLIEKARTVFEWGPGPKPGKAPKGPKQAKGPRPAKARATAPKSPVPEEKVDAP